MPNGKADPDDEHVPVAGCGDLEFPQKAGKVGLRNLGNTCFMNAGLQCLSHLEPLAGYFLSGSFEEELNRSNPLGSKGKLAEAFADLQRSLWLTNESHHDPQAMHRQLRAVGSHLFDGYEQQDVQEFLAFCLDGLHEDLNRVLVRPPPPSEEVEKEDERLAAQRGDEFAAALAWLRYLERGKSFLVDLLQGQLQSSLTCLQCGHRSRRFDPFLYLSLPVTQEMTSLTEALKAYLEEETLTADERWHCEKCKVKVDARKKIDLWKLPPILVLHLKRFAFDSRSGRFRKITSNLKTDDSLDLGSFCSSKQRFGTQYQVWCVANHSGPYGHGHYTATCRVRGSKGEEALWHHFNDARVTELKPGQEVVGPEAYVIFLVRCRQDTRKPAYVKRQTVSMPELWPHWLSQKKSAVDVLMRQAQVSDPNLSPASNEDKAEDGDKAPPPKFWCCFPGKLRGGE